MVDIQITQSHCIMSCRSISCIVESGRIPDKIYLEILALQYIISHVAMDSFTKVSCSCNRTFQNSLCGR